jgi:hypothetical protein
VKQKWLIAGGGLVIQLFVVASRFIPGIPNVWKSVAPEQAQWIFAGVNFAIMLGTLSLLLLKEAGSNAEFHAQLISKVNGAAVRKVTDSEFYAEFEAAQKNAKHTVRICYFAPYAPGDTGHSERKWYYDQLLKTIKQKPSVKFRRLERNSSRKLAWMGQLATCLQGVPNADLAVLDDLPETEEMPLALSVQVIDDDRVWFVALAGHERTDQYRDVYIQSVEVGEAMKLYFDRLWGKARVIIDAGRITAEGQAYLSGQ